MALKLPKPHQDFTPSYKFEEEAAKAGALRIAGIDEAGRGPLAGPVVAAAVVLGPSCHIPEINDSKLLSGPQRDKLYPQIMAGAVAVGIGIVSPQIIDEINIYQATLEAMKEAAFQITPLPDFLLVDGKMKLKVETPQKSIVKGDRLSFSIAAAGIVAKVTRDGIMMELHKEYPQYGFAGHKGYPTKAHKEALERYGPSPVHRMCFKGVCRLDDLPLFDPLSVP
jgi:ribonuclease HII